MAKTPKPSSTSPTSTTASPADYASELDRDTIEAWESAFGAATDAVAEFQNSAVTLLADDTNLLGALNDLVQVLPLRRFIPDRLAAAIGPLKSLGAALLRYHNLARHTPRDSDPIWSALESLRMALTAADKRARHDWPPLESLQLLHDQGVTHSQIALIYGLVPKGQHANAYAHLIDAELKEHGSMVDWSEWKDPREVAADEVDKAAIEDSSRDAFALSALAHDLSKFRRADNDDGRPRTDAEAMALTGAQLIER